MQTNIANAPAPRRNTNGTQRQNLRAVPSVRDAGRRVLNALETLRVAASASGDETALLLAECLEAQCAWLVRH